MCVVCDVSFDQSKADAFAGEFVRHLNGAAIMMMTSIGYRTGLFDAMADGAGYTSRTLASKARLAERYVREWLGAMVTGGIVEYDPQTQEYSLPPERAALLSRGGSDNNLALTAQWVSVLGAVETDVVEAFRHGQGVPYSAYDRFHEVMADESSQSVVPWLENQILPLVPGLIQKLEAGIDVADIGCGSGLALLKLAERFPNSRFTGVDLSTETTAAGNARARSEGLKNLTFVAQDLTTWGATSAFDLILAFDAIHDQAHPDRVLANIRRALRPGATFLMQDIKASSQVDRQSNQPLAPWIYTISCMHCMSVSLAQGGQDLGAAWGKELALKMLREAGFEHTTVNELPHDILNYYYVNR